MSDISVKEVQHAKYGRCVELSNGSVDLYVTVDKGPRVIRFGFFGRENELCEDSPFTVDTFAGKWQMYGGHRLWHSPEANPRTYMPDNGPVEFTLIENGVRVTQETEPWVQLQKEMEVTLAGCCNRVRVIHRITNRNAWPVKLSAWAITVMAKGGLEVVPQVTRDTGLLANRLLSLWPYTKMNDHRVWWGDKYITLKQDEKTAAPFKFGLPNEEGWAAYFNHGNLFLKRFPHVKDAEYPDFGASYETYTTDYMLEMESLSPFVQLEPDAAITHVEEWELIENIAPPARDDEQEIDKAVSKYIKCCDDCR